MAIMEAAMEKVKIVSLTAGVTLSAGSYFPCFVASSAEKYEVRELATSTKGATVMRCEQIVPDGAGDRNAAEVVRRTWLKMMGLTDDEIECDIRDNPLDLREEIENLLAMNDVQKLNKCASGKK